MAKSSVPAWRRRLYLPAYTVTDAARYARTSTQTVSYWHYSSRPVGPVLPGKERRAPLSYLQLVEVSFVAAFRAKGLSLQKIRKAHEYAAQTLHAEFPFAELRWKTEGIHLLLDLNEIEQDADLGRVILGDSAGQLAWEDVLSDRFAEFDYDDESGLALTWHVAGRQSRVQIDPRVSFGAPVIKGIPTWAVRERWGAGESRPDIADDFNLTEEDITEALMFEGIEVAA